MAANSAESEEDASTMSSKQAKDDELPHAEENGCDATVPNDRSSTSDTVSETKALPSKKSRTLSASSAAAPARRSMKTQRRAGFREKFLQQLRVLVDRESKIGSTIVQWSTDGKRFIIMDASKFESDIIPTYFDNPIAFTSFLNKLSRWGFNRVTRKKQKNGRYEFCSPTFTRLNAVSAPATATTDTSNDGEDDSTQQQQVQASHIMEVITQNSQPPPPQPSQVAVMMDLISNIQRMNQQLNEPSQLSNLNQNASQPNSDVVNSILQSIMGSVQQSSQLNVPSLQSALTHNTIQPSSDVVSSILQSVMSSIQQPSSQPSNPNPIPTMTLFNNYIGGQTSSVHLTGYPQGNQVNALTNLSGLLSQQSTYPNTSSTASPSQLNNTTTLQSLLMLLHRVDEEERQRRALSDTLQNVIISNIVQSVGLSNTINELERQRGLEPAGGIPPGTTISVPLRPRQVGRPSSAAARQNIQASGSSGIAAMLHAARTSEQQEVEVDGDCEKSRGIGRDDSDENEDEDSSDSRGKRSQSRRKKRKRRGDGAV